VKQRFYEIGKPEGLAETEEYFSRLAPGRESSPNPAL
jgi:hypothetical protein